MVSRKAVPPDNDGMVRDVRHQLGQKIKALRVKLGLTQDELAWRAGISTKFLQNLEGKTPKKATIITLQKIAIGFKIPLWKLLKF